MGSTIQKEDKLCFESILPTGKIVENWYINDVKKKYETDSTMVYYVNASDLKGTDPTDLTLKVSVTFQ